MPQKIEKILSKYWVLILSFLILPTFVFILRPGYFPMQDDLQAFRTQQMFKCFLDLQIPCRWVPDMGYQFGYPQFNFYAPSVFYFGALFHFIGVQFIDSVKIMFVLGFLLSGIFMYLFLRAFVKDQFLALMGALMYIYVPSRAVQVYVRGAISEFWALVFFPLLFWASLKLIETKKKVYFGLLSLSIGGLLITHNLLSFLFFPVFLVWVLVLIYNRKDRSVLKRVLLSVLLGFGLAAFFILPLFFEKQFVHTESLLGGYFDYRQHFVDINQLFFSNYFGYGSSQLGPNDDLSLSTGIVQWVLGLLGFLIAILKYKTNKQVALMVGALGFVELILLLMMHQKSSFIWERMPFLAYLQFPWRLMSISTFLLIIIAFLGISEIKNKKQKYLIAFLGALLAIVLTSSFFYPKQWLNISDQNKFSGVSWEKQLTISIFDYLPIYAKLPPNHKAFDNPEILDGQAEVLSYKKGSNFQVGLVDVKKPTTLRIPLFDFPGMRVLVDGKTIKHSHDDCRFEEYCLGLISFQLTSGRHMIDARLTDTPIRRIANLVSLISGGLVFFIFFKSKDEIKI